jgi:hypothetical protein
MVTHVHALSQVADVTAYLDLLHRFIGTIASLQRQHAVFTQCVAAEWRHDFDVM